MAKKRKNDLGNTSVEKAINYTENVNLNLLVVILLGVLLFFPPFFRGMFFREEFVIVHMATAVIFMLYYQGIFVKSSRKFLVEPLDYANFALVICYALSILIAINKDLGIAFAWRQINYFAIYWLLANAVRSLKDVHRLLQVFYVSGLVVAGITLGTMVGFWNYNAAYQNGIVQTTLQYKNAGAILLAALSYFGFFFWVRDSRTWMKVFYGIGNYIYLFIIFGSQSRAVWVLYPVFFALLIAGFSNGKRLISIFNIVLISGLTFTLSSQAYQKVLEGEPSGAWVWLFLAFGIIAGVQYLVAYLASFKVSRKLATAGVLVIIFALLGGVLILQKNTGSQNAASFLPANIYEKITTLSIKERNISERTYFWQDALTMVKERPVLGYGGGGWRSGYRQYASYHYNSNEEHNHFLKVAVETGLLGFLSYLAIWATFLLLVAKFIFKTPPSEAKSTLWLITVSALALGVHSFFDFDLSLGAIAIVLWSCFGLARGIERLTLDPEPKAKKWAAKPIWQQGLVWTVGLVFFIFSFSVMLSNQYFAVSQEQGKDADSVRNELSKAASFNPLNAEIKANLSQVYAFLAQQNQSLADGEKALDYAAKAVELEPSDTRWHQLDAIMLLRFGNPGLAITKTEKIIATNPFGPSSYEIGAKNYFQAGITFLIQVKDQDKANQNFQKVVGMEARINRILAQLTPEEKQLQATGNGFTLTPTFYLSIGQAYTMLGKYDQAMKYLNQAGEANGEVLFWRGIILEKTGQKEQAEVLYQQAYQSNPALKNFHNQIINALS